MSVHTKTEAYLLKKINKLEDQATLLRNKVKKIESEIAFNRRTLGSHRMTIIRQRREVKKK